MKTKMKLLAVALCAGCLAAIQADPIPLAPAPTPSATVLRATVPPEVAAAKLAALTTGSNALLSIPEGTQFRTLTVRVLPDGSARIEATVVSQ